MSKLVSAFSHSKILSFNQVRRDAWVAEQARAIPPGASVLDVGAGSCPYRNLFERCVYRSQDAAELAHGNCWGNLDTARSTTTATPRPSRWKMARSMLCSARRSWSTSRSRSAWSGSLPGSLKPGGKAHPLRAARVLASPGAVSFLRRVHRALVQPLPRRRGFRDDRRPAELRLLSALARSPSGSSLVCALGAVEIRAVNTSRVCATPWPFRSRSDRAAGYGRLSCVL